MTNLSDSKPLVYKPLNKVRFVTAASLFDGHDASINIMRRILQASGCEVIHLGHNRSVREIVDCALQEDAHGIAISSYQGGHVEFFKYMIDHFREAGDIMKVLMAAAASSSRPRSASCDYGWPASSRRRGKAWPAGHDQEVIISLCDTDLSSRMFRRWTTLQAGRANSEAGPADHRARGRRGCGAVRKDLHDRVAKRKCRRWVSPVRRRGQELAHRRAGAPVPARPEGRAADRDPFDRPVAAQVRWRAAR
jgi:methylmalonyl-CoA mutase cobalamin-binding subunit